MPAPGATRVAPPVRVPRVVASYREAPAGAIPEAASKAARPAWVARAVEATLARLTRDYASAFGAGADLALTSATQDDAGNVLLRLAQRRDGVEVYRGQALGHVAPDGRVRSIGGRTFDTTGAEANPSIDRATAIAAAASVEGFAPPYRFEPAVRLVVLPRSVVTGNERDGGATLAYGVTISPSLASADPRPREIFVDARDASVVWSRATRASERGIAYTLYSGRVTVGTTPIKNDRYRLRDPEQGNSETWDGKGASDGSGKAFVDREDDVWGDGTLNSRQTIAGDAQFGLQEAWTYYRDTFGRVGADGTGTGVDAVVYFGSGLNNAYGGGNEIDIGMGDGATYGPFASLDVLGHEFTHCVVEATAELPGEYEGGAINESIADIFGNAVEHFGGNDPDYLVGEDVYTPGTPGDAIRDMASPTIDHYSKLRRLSTGETADDSNDNAYVHANSGIMSNAFYLLAEGGTNATSGTSVPAIGREAAEAIFYYALTTYMFAGTDYVRAANSTLGAASDLYGYDSTVYRAVDRAWHAVGVLVDAEPPQDVTLRKILCYASYDGSAATGSIAEDRTFTSLVTYPAGSFSTGWTSVVGDGTDVFYYNRDNGAAAVGNVDGAGNHVTTRGWGPGFFGPGWTHVTRHEGSLFFYDEASGNAAIGQLTGPSGFTQYNSYRGTFSRWWTHIVSVQGRLLFYDARTGVTAIGDLESVFDGQPGQFPSLVRIDFRQFSNATLAAGWTSIVDTGNGILFYNAETGAYVVGDIDATGVYADRTPGTTPFGNPMWTYSNLGPFYTHVVRVKDTILFYDLNQGYAMTARMRGTSIFEVDGEPLITVQNFGLPVGWTDVVASVDPSSPH